MAGVLRLTFDEFLCFKEEEDGKIMHTERHETFASMLLKQYAYMHKKQNKMGHQNSTFCYKNQLLT